MECIRDEGKIRGGEVVEINTIDLGSKVYVVVMLDWHYTSIATGRRWRLVDLANSQDFRGLGLSGSGRDSENHLEDNLSEVRYLAYIGLFILFIWTLLPR
jgi:hypothetical protein